MTNLLDIFDRMKDKETNSLDDRVLIIDGLNTYLRIFSSVPVISENGEHVGGIIGMLRSIGKEIREFTPTRCVIVFDGKGGSLRRKKLYPQYKENRAGKYNLKREFFSSKEEEDLARKRQLIRVIEYLEFLPVQIICMPHIEADDVIANLTQHFSKKSSKVRIVSTDRDFLQLVTDTVEVYSPVKKKLYDLKAIEDEFGIHPKNYLLYRVLDGDDSDNIPGVSGLGLKSLKKYFPEVLKKEVGVEYLIDTSKLAIQSKKSAKVYSTILDSLDVINRNLDLMQLQEVDISGSSKMRIFEMIEQPVPKLDRMSLRKLLIEDYLNKSFKDFDSWLNSTFNILNTWSTK